MVGMVLFANAKTIVMTDRTPFEAPDEMRLPRYPAGTALVIEYEVVEGRNVLTAVP